MKVVPLSNYQRLNAPLLPDQLSDILGHKRRTQLHQSSTVRHACVRLKEQALQADVRSHSIVYKYTFIHSFIHHSWRGLRCIYERVMMIKLKDNNSKNNKEKEWQRKKERKKERKRERIEEWKMDDSRSLLEIEIDTYDIQNRKKRGLKCWLSQYVVVYDSFLR